MSWLLLGLRASAATDYRLIRGCISAGIPISSNYFGIKSGGRMMSSDNSAEDSPSPPSTLPSRISPWLMLPPSLQGGDMFYNFYSFEEDKVVSYNKRDGSELSAESPDDDALLVGSSHGWLALFNQRNNDLFLSNPLIRQHIKLPPIHTLPIPEENLRHGQWCVSKVIISSPPNVEECRAMMSFGPENRLAFCWPNHSTKWTPIGTVNGESFFGPFVRRYEDFIYSKRQKLFFCITEFQDIEAWDLGDPQSPRLVWSDWSRWLSWPVISDWRSESFDDRTPNYLVFSEEADQLFYVKRSISTRIGPDGPVRCIHLGKYYGWDDSYPYKTSGFDCFKVDWVSKVDWAEGGETLWTKMKYSLDGLAMFLGINHSFAISVAEYPELKLQPNCIYFTDQKELTPPRSFGRVLYDYGGHDLGIFDFKSKTFSPCYFPSDVQRITPSPLWFTPSSH